MPKNFFETGEVREILNRGVTYLSAGVPLHLSGPSGVGKTSLAIRMATTRGRPVSIMTGHQDLTSDDFNGRNIGATQSTVVDKYIQSVQQKKTTTSLVWQDSKLVEAMRYGHTLIFDEFTRATPQTNIILLSVLEEGFLVSKELSDGESYIHAHPDFRMILTSNPSDYVAVNSSPDALMDRLVSINLSGYSQETETIIVSSTTGLCRSSSRRVVGIVRKFREMEIGSHIPSIRTALLISRILAELESEKRLNDQSFSMVVLDVLAGRNPDVNRSDILASIDSLFVKSD